MGGWVAPCAGFHACCLFATLTHCCQVTSHEEADGDEHSDDEEDEEEEETDEEGEELWVDPQAVVCAGENLALMLL